MKFKSYKGFSLVQFIVVIAIIALFALLTPTRLKAQPYYTNSTAANGAYLPNSSAVNAYQAYVVQKAQLNTGIQAGTITATSTGKATNTFNPTYVYTVAPAVTVTQLGAAQSGTNLVLSVTTSNFVWQSGAPSAVASFTAVGH